MTPPTAARCALAALFALALSVRPATQPVTEDWRIQSWATRFRFDFQNNICVDGSGPLKDFYARKFDPRGNLIWEQSSGSPLVNEHSRWMTVDSRGSIIVTGHRNGGTTVPGGMMTVKFSANGTELWSVVAPASNEGYRVEVDAADNVYVFGRVFDLTGRRDDFLTIKYDPDGNEVWRNQRDFGLNQDTPQAMAVSPSGRVAVSGSTNVTMAVVVYDENGREVFGDVHSPVRGGHDVLLAADGSVFACGLDSRAGGTLVHWDAAGIKQWAAVHRTPHSAFGNLQRLAMDAAGNVVAIGWGTGRYGYQDWLVAKFDPAGNLLWGTTHDGFDFNDEFGTAIAVGPDGGVYASGLSGTPGCSPTAPRGLGTTVIRYEPDGRLGWIYEAPCFGTRALGLGLDSLGEIVVNGGAGRLMRLVREKWMTVPAGLAGSAGTPALEVRGYLQPSAPLSLALTGALATAPGVHVLGNARVNLPFAGGTLVPHWTALVPLITDALGSAGLVARMPTFVPVATELSIQSWVLDAGGPQGLSASNAVVKGLQ